MRALATLTAALTLLGTAGCLFDPASGRQEQLGVIQVLPSFPAQVGVPETAGVGEPFVVSVITHGGGCLQPGPTRVRREGMTVDVRPYDIETDGDVCTMDVTQYQHVATLTFDQAGTATIRFRGIGHPERDVVTVTRTVTIQ